MSKKQKGYTVVEVLLFLAISGALLSISIIGMNGQQNRLRFQQSMQDVEFRIRSTLNNVDQGYLAKPDNNSTYSCIGNSVSSQGANSSAGCVFIGKEVNMCSTDGDFTISTLVAPYNNADYTNPGRGLGATVATATETFAPPGGVRIVNSNNPCSVSAQFLTLGTNNSKVPRYTANATGSWQPANDNSPPVLCFRDVNGTNQYATITVTQADIKLEVNTAPCS